LLRSVRGASSKLVDRAVVSYGAEVLSHVVPQALDDLLRAGARRRLSVLEAVAVALDSYRHSYTLSLVRRWLRGEASLGRARDVCREAGYAIASRARELGVVAEVLLSLLDHDLLIASVLPRLGVWGACRRLSRAQREVSELSKCVSTASAAVALAAEAWGRGAYSGFCKALEAELKGLAERIDAALDTVAILLDPDNDAVAREVARW